MSVAEDVLSTLWAAVSCFGVVTDATADADDDVLLLPAPGLKTLSDIFGRSVLSKEMIC